MIRSTKLLTSAGYGAADIVLEWADATVLKSSGKPFQNAHDLGRLAAVVGGIALNYYGRDPTLTEVGEALALSALPSLERSAYRAVRGMGVSKYQGRLILRTPGSVEGAEPLVRVPLSDNVF